MCQFFVKHFCVKLTVKFYIFSLSDSATNFQDFNQWNLLALIFILKCNIHIKKKITIICKVNCIAAMERVLFFLNMVQKAHSKYRKPLLTQFGKKCDWCLFQGKQFDCLYKSRGQFEYGTIPTASSIEKQAIFVADGTIDTISDTLPALSNHFPEISRRIHDKRNAWLLVFFK